MRSIVSPGASHRRHHCRRSRNGCLTCKRRKVRCDEQKPQCYHCRRLNLDCVWKDNGLQQPSPSRNTGNPSESNVAVDGPSPSADLFDFAQSMTDPTRDFSLFQDIYLADICDLNAPGHTLHERLLSTDVDAPVSPPAPPQSSIVNVDAEDSLPLHVPPILDPVENGPKCASVRGLFDSMAGSSPMVHYSIAAFAAIQLCTPGGKVRHQQYYDKAANELLARFHKHEGSMAFNSDELGYVLTTIFFLTYTNVCLFDSVRIYSLLSLTLDGAFDWTAGFSPLESCEGA